MRLRRSFLVLAMLAALIGAPPSASAASNVLHSPSASPNSGTTAAVFRLRVRYEGRFAATVVQAHVARLSMPMTRVAGSRTDGTWESLVALPAGTWPVSFSATVERGNPPSVSGPTLDVAARVGAARTTPEPEPEPPADPAPDPAPDSVPEPASPQRTPDAAAAEAPSSDGERTGGDATAEPAPAAAPRSRAGGSRTSDGAPDDGPAGGPDGGHRAPRNRPSSDHGPRPGPDDRAAHDHDDATTAPPEATSAADPGPAVAAEEDMVGAAIRVAALSTALLVSVMGVLFALAARRRRHETGEEDAAAGAADTEALLARRARRRAGVLIPDDPIVAAMNLDEGDSVARRASRRRVRQRADSEDGS